MDETSKLLDVTEIVKVPRNYIESHMTTQSASVSDRFQERTRMGLERFLGSLLYLNTTLAFRIQVISGEPRMTYLTYSDHRGMSTIESAFLAQFPDFELKTHQEPISLPVEGNVYVAHLGRVPKSVADSLNGIAQIMTQVHDSSFYQVSMKPRSTGGIKGKARRFLAKKRFESVSEKAQKQVTHQSWFKGQETRTIIDADAHRKAKRYEREYQKLCAERVFATSVILAFWGSLASEVSLQNAVNTLLAAISHESKDEQIEVTYLDGINAIRAVERACRLEDIGKSTDLSPREAVVYFQVPTTDIGVQQNSPAQFTTASTVRHTSQHQNSESVFRPGYVTLGHIYRRGKIDPHQVKLVDIQDLRRHTLIVGMTGTGKSSTRNRIVIDAWRNGIPSLLIEPAKEDARILMGAIPELRVFTLGKETAAPFRQNPFWVEKGVPVQMHVNLLYACFVAGWPLYGMLANYTRRIISRTYVNNGWDILLDVHGVPITLEMFRAEVERFCDEVLQYGSELSQDFRGALIARAEDLCDPTRAAIFNTMTELPISDLFSRPTIIELKHLGDPEFTAFALSLLLVRVCEYFDSLGPSDCLHALLVIDEAHRVLEELPKTLDMSDAAVARKQVVDQFVNLIAEGRSYGLGAVLADQIPTRLAQNALKNCHIRIVHKLKSAEDRELMACEIGCNDEQKNHIAVMRVGEAVISEPSSVTPINVQIVYDPDYYPDMKRNWSDDDVRERMCPFYEKHPGFAETPSIPILPRKMVDDESVYLAVRVNDIVLTRTFQELWSEAIYLDQQNSSGRHLEELLAFYAIHLSHIQISPIEISEQILELATATYGPPQRQPNLLVIKLFIEKIESHELRQLRRGQPAP